MKKTSKKSTVTISVAAFVILLLGIGLLVWVLPARNAEKEESAATPPESTVHETALSAPATQKENAESTNADTSEHTTTSEQEPIDEEKSRKKSLPQPIRQRRSFWPQGTGRQPIKRLWRWRIIGTASSAQTPSMRV